MLRPWPLLETREVADHRIFRIRTDRKRSPRTDKALDFVVIECPDWVNVVAITPEDQVVMIEQFRHGTNTLELEVPGGMIDSTDPTPIAAGLRELREETGYEGSAARLLASVHPNPAIMTNTCYTVLVEGSVLRHPVALDHGEDLVTRLVPAREIPALVASGRVRHSLVVVALLQYQLTRQPHARP